MSIKRDFIYDPSLVLYLPLYELDGASFMSKDAYGHLCTVTGALWRPNGRLFDGDDDYITVPYHTALTLSLPFALSVWINPDSTQADANGRPIDKGRNYSFTWNKTTKVITVEYHAGIGWRGMVSTGSVSASVWTLVTIVLTASDSDTLASFYFNDQLDSSATDTGQPIAAATVNVVIGGTAGVNLKGLIGEAWLYNRALTPLEIQRNYLATKWRYQ